MINPPSYEEAYSWAQKRALKLLKSKAPVREDAYCLVLLHKIKQLENQIESYKGEINENRSTTPSWTEINPEL